MTEYNILIEKEEDGYLVSEVVELPGCHTQAKSMGELIKRTKEAILLYIKSKSKCDITTNPEFVGLQKIEV